MTCFETLGINKIALYSNQNVRFFYPDITDTSTIETVDHDGFSVVIDDYIEYPSWQRESQNSANYTQSFKDTFQFYLNGIENETPEILTRLLNSRYGFIVEIMTKDGDNYVFQAPVFVDKKLTKKENSRTWKVILTYRKETKKDYLYKSNSLFMTHQFIKVSSNPLTVLGTNKGEAIVTESKQIKI